MESFYEPGKNAVKQGKCVIEEVLITPAIAAEWLNQNGLNRPKRPKHIVFLGGEMAAGNWVLNGETIKISSKKNILDGQHRLQACIDYGVSFRSLVVSNVPNDAFKTIDTGKARTGADAIFLHVPGTHAKTAATLAAALTWRRRLLGGLAKDSNSVSVSNTELLVEVSRHPKMWSCVEFTAELKQGPALVPVSACTALLYLIQSQHADKAATFIRGLLTGEQLSKTNPAFVLRTILQRDLLKRSRLPTSDKVFMAVKAWNLFLRGKQGTAKGIHRRGDEVLSLTGEHQRTRQAKAHRARARELQSRRESRVGT